MGFRHWVGGTGNWDAANTANWSLTAGGAGGASVPTPSDIVVIGSTSGSGTITASNSTEAVCGGLLFANSSMQIAGTFATYAGMTIGSGQTWGTASVYLLGGGSIQTNGVSIAGSVVLDANTGTVTLSDALTSGSTMFVYSGTLTTNNNSITCAGIQFLGSGAKVLNLGTSFINFSGTIGFGGATNLTTNGNWTANWVQNGGNGILYAATGLSYYDLRIVGTGVLQTNGSLSFNNIYNVPNGTGQTFKPRRLASVSCNSLSFNGSMNSTKFILASDLAGARATIYVTGPNVYCEYIDIKDSNVFGSSGQTFRAGPWSVNSGNNVGWTFSDKAYSNFIQFFKNPI
jgi:hypothetical protein